MLVALDSVHSLTYLSSVIKVYADVQKDESIGVSRPEKNEAGIAWCSVQQGGCGCSQPLVGQTGPRMPAAQLS